MNDPQNPRTARPQPQPQPVYLPARARMDTSSSSTGTSPEMAENRGKPPNPDPTEGLDPPARGALANLVVGYRVDSTFRALADPTRRAMLALLADGEKSVAEMTRGFAMSGAGAAKHLAVLEAAGLVRQRREGRRCLCTLDADPLAEAALWLRRWQRFESPKAARLRAMLDAAERIA